MTEKEPTFYEKFLKLINELKAPKNQRNNFGNYNYRSAEDILEAVKPLALESGLIPNLSDELVLIGDRYYVKATASITDGVTKLESTGFAREEENKKGMDGSQITGTASSYARKYAMNGLYQIDDTKDADTDEFKNQTNKQNNASNTEKMASPKQVGMLKAKMFEYTKMKNGNIADLEKFFAEKYKVNNVYESTSKITSIMIKAITDMIEKA